MNSDFLILISVLFAGFLILFFLIKKAISDSFQKQKPSEEVLEIVKLLAQTSKEDRKTLLESLQRNTNALNARLDKAAQIIGSVQKNIGEISEIGRGMKDLQEFLRSPKLRGNIGEQVLKELLSQMLPKKSFNLQHKFKSGNIVDAAITTSSGIIPIDSKFPMETFRKMLSSKDEKEKKLHTREFETDVKKHISDISSKYILTDEGTIDYALMYVPSESVYYEIVNNSRLFDFAGENRVLPVSPTTFYAYIKAILMSFEGQKIEKQAKTILSALKSIRKNYENVEGSLNILGKHITNASNTMNNVFMLFAKLGQKIDSTKSLEDEKPEQQRLT